jgi:hypothetical protein
MEVGGRLNVPVVFALGESCKYLLSRRLGELHYRSGRFAGGNTMSYTCRELNHDSLDVELVG